MRNAVGMHARAEQETKRGSASFARISRIPVSPCGVGFRFI